MSLCGLTHSRLYTRRPFVHCEAAANSCAGGGAQEGARKRTPPPRASHLPFLQMGQHCSGSYTGSTHSVWGHADTVHSTSPLASQRHLSHGDTWNRSPRSGCLPRLYHARLASPFPRAGSRPPCCRIAAKTFPARRSLERGRGAAAGPWQGPQVRRCAGGHGVPLPSPLRAQGCFVVALPLSCLRKGFSFFQY